MAVKNLPKICLNSAYSVVQFTLEDETISAVPSTWVTKDKTQCQWPPGPPESLIRRAVRPNSTWPFHSVIVLEENIGTANFFLV